MSAAVRRPRRADLSRARGRLADGEAAEAQYRRGYQPETPDFNACLQRVDNEHDSRMQTRRQEMLEKSGAPNLNRGQ